MSMPTTVVQISACHIFYKAGIRCVLVLGRYENNKRIIDFVCFQVHTSSQNHDMNELSDLPWRRASKEIQVRYHLAYTWLKSFFL